MTVERWRQRPVVVEAMYLTADTADTVAEWSGGTLARTLPGGAPHFVLLGPHSLGVEPTEQGGWWIVRGGDGSFTPVRDTEWRATHEPVNPDCPKGWRNRFGSTASTSSPATMLPTSTTQEAQQ